MSFIKTIRVKPLILSLLIPLGLGGAVGLFLALTKKFESYQELFRPPFSPPAWLFPIVWTLLYTLMGISSYLIVTSDVTRAVKEDALWQYLVQLGINLIWPFLFFYFEMRLAAFIWIVILIAAVIKMIVDFWSINRTAALLQIPYVLWLLFATYLNGAVYLLNG